jgi:hypothetical protein
MKYEAIYLQAKKILTELFLNVFLHFKILGYGSRGCRKLNFIVIFKIGACPLFSNYGHTKGFLEYILATAQ